LSIAPATPERARLFFALWPNDGVRSALAALARDVQAECGGRAIARENLHLTLFFVGSFDRARIAALESAADSLRTTIFDLVLDRLGYWPHNRIVWTGATQCPTALAALATDLRAALAREGIAGETRPYAPHLTLVRNAERKPAARRLPACQWAVRELALVESVPVGGAVRYDVTREWSL
jgi:RNA 2',3'-cyclic 3'-phosphodiesterase